MVSFLCLSMIFSENRRLFSRGMLQSSHLHSLEGEPDGPRASTDDNSSGQCRPVSSANWPSRLLEADAAAAPSSPGSPFFTANLSIQEVLRVDAKRANLLPAC